MTISNHVESFTLLSLDYFRILQERSVILNSVVQQFLAWLEFLIAWFHYFVDALLFRRVDFKWNTSISVNIETTLNIIRSPFTIIAFNSYMPVFMFLCPLKDNHISSFSL